MLHPDSAFVAVSRFDDAASPAWSLGRWTMALVLGFSALSADAATSRCESALSRDPDWTADVSGEAGAQSKSTLGDFDGAGPRGQAVLGLLRRAPTIAVCLRDGRREPVFIDVGVCPGEGTLTRLKAGQRVIDYDDPRVNAEHPYIMLKLKHDALTYSCDNKPGETYIYVGGRFRGFLSSD